MIIKYRVISGEKDDFVRDIELFSDSTFMDFHLAIEASCDFDPNLITTFYLSNKSWDKLDEVALDRIDAELQAEVLLMEETKLEHFEPVVGQRFIYIFDFFSVRAFFIEIVNIRKSTKDDEHLEFPICTLSHGKSPRQVFIDDISEDDLDDFGSFDEEDDDEFGMENIDNYDI
jgi:hypothetical protein